MTTDDSPPILSALEGQRTCDALCKSCGYNLRGIPLNRRCPECGNFFVDSVHHNELKFANHAWLLKLMWGALLLAIAPVLCAIVAAGFLVFRPGSSFSLRTPGPMEIIYLCASAIEATGILLLASKEPSPELPETRTLARTAQRLVALAAFGLEVVFYEKHCHNFVAARLSHSLMACLVLVLAAGIIARGLLLAYTLERFIERIPDPIVAHELLTATWAICLWVAGAAILLFFPEFLVVFMVASIGPVIFLYLWRWLLFFRCARKFWACAKFSRDYGRN